MVYKAAIYIRLSKEDGDKLESNSISNQRTLIHSFVEGKEDIEICEEGVDDGYSGIDFNRPAIQKLLEHVKSGNINCMIVKDLSRFGRNYIETGRYIQQIFPFMGVRFIAINDNYDSLKTESEMDSILLPFKNLMNDCYCRDLSVKIRSQIEVRQKRGDYIGAFPVYGYFKDTVQKNKLVIDEIAAMTVREIYAMRLAGFNNQEIAISLNKRGVPSPMEYKALLHWKYTTPFQQKPQAKWSKVAVDRILKNEIYTGTMVQGKEKTLNYKVKKRIPVLKEDWIRVENTHDGIISKEYFNAVQDIMLWDTRTAPQKQSLYVLSGFLKCSDCGCNMVRRTITSGNQKYVYYICSTNKKEKDVCSSHRIREDDLLGAVFAMLQAHMLTLCQWEKLSLEMKEEPLPTKKYRIQLECRKKDLQWYQKLKGFAYEDYKGGLLSKGEYLEMKDSYEAMCKQIQGAIEMLEKGIIEKEIVESEIVESEIIEEAEIMKQECAWHHWIEKCKNIVNINELNRGFIALSIEKVIVFDAQTISIQYKYQDAFKQRLGSR